ncbi:MAG: hypothetical protein Q4C95_09590 [Planctomycetia bacterium]|nr:hypothetical protein [Planctomycetia bacterium]
MNFVKTTLSFYLSILFFSCIVGLNGCSQPQFVNDNDLGKTVDQVPELDNCPLIYELPKEIDDEDCIIKRRILNHLENERKHSETK